MSSFTGTPALNEATVKVPTRPEMPWPLVKLTEHPLRWVLNKLIQLFWVVILTWIGVKIVAGAYYLAFEVYPPFTKAWHGLFPGSSLRHNIRNVGEGFYGGLLAQLVVWNHYRPKGLFARIPPFKQLNAVVSKLESALRLPVAQDGRQSSKLGITAALVLALAYAVPGFLIAQWIAHKAGGGAEHLKSAVAAAHFHVPPHAASVWAREKSTITSNWPEKVMGYGAAFFWGRRPAKGAFDDIQYYFAQRRIASGKKYGRLSTGLLPPGFLARYNEMQGTVSVQHARSRRRSRTKLGMGILVAANLGLFGLGFYVLNFIAKAS